MWTKTDKRPLYLRVAICANEARNLVERFDKNLTDATFTKVQELRIELLEVYGKLPLPVLTTFRPVRDRIGEAIQKLDDLLGECADAPKGAKANLPVRREAKQRLYAVEFLLVLTLTELGQDYN